MHALARTRAPFETSRVVAVTFIISRDIFYPYVVWSSIVEHSRYTPTSLDQMICCGLLCILLVLQFYWTALIFIAVYNQMKKGGIEDIRSDDEDSDEETEDRPKIARKKEKGDKRD